MNRWLLLGAAVGALVALVVFAPAAWLAGFVTRQSGGYFILSDARGSVWSGSAVLVLTAGEGSRDASALPGRLHWNVGLDGLAASVRLRHACCLTGEQRLRIVPGLGRMRIELLPRSQGGSFGQWPAAWLSGLGTPWNTLQLTGALQLSTPGLVLESAGGRWTFTGRADLELHSLASRISTLDMLGSYRLTLAGDAAAREGTSVLLTTQTGALQLSGSGQFAAGRLRFRGQASAAPGAEAALNNLLNIIGRRQGAQSVISIG
ncbi:MAG: type II secretion system protein N [Betaproteobacteria bacterium]|nr:type II secretion system protein N [Betaproteobacteria bacterium]MCC6851863.1 type II secretion system protein N [Rubrivivax sp.]MCL4699563.1 type II secretion system protein N [Burkholderiaceae bacterium]